MPKFAPEACFVQPGLPSPFCAEGYALVESARAAIECIGREGSQAYMVVVDETVFSKGHHLLYGLLPNAPHKGGIHPKHSMLECKEGEEKIPPLEKEHLATISLCVGLKTVDQRGNLFQIQHIPRQRVVDSVGEFHNMGLIAESCALFAIFCIVQIPPSSSLSFLSFPFHFFPGPVFGNLCQFMPVYASFLDGSGVCGLV